MKTNSKTNEAEVIAAAIDAPKKRRGGKLDKLGPGKIEEVAPVTVEEARSNLRVLVVTYEEAREMAKKCKQRVTDYTDKETGEVIRPCRLPQNTKDTIVEIGEVYSAKADSLLTHMRRQMRVFPVYNLWLKDVGGVGDVACAALLADVDIHRARHSSSLQQLCGLGTEEGEDGKRHAQRATRGAPLSFHMRLKVALNRAFDSLLKQKDGKRVRLYAEGGKALKDEHGKVQCQKGEDGEDVRAFSPRVAGSPYLLRVLDYKHRLLTSSRYDAEKNTWDGRKGGRAIVHSMAWRPGAQLFLEHLYYVWRSIEGLEVRVPYYAAQRGREHGGSPVAMEYRKLTVEEAIAATRQATPCIFAAGHVPLPLVASNESAPLAEAK